MSAIERESVASSAFTPALPLHEVSQVADTLAYFTWRRHLKRVVDIGLVVLALPVVLPLMLVIAVVVKVGSRGPILYRQERIGRYGRRFTMLKFRTMSVDAADRLTLDNELRDRYIRNDFKLAASEDPRIVPCGRFLRCASLDELPQLFNVLRGQMSLVGPRPIIADELVRYGSRAAAYLSVKPGITGRWQCDGRNDVRYPERALIDEEYLCNWSLGRDFMILARTIPCVLRRRGCH